jgi:hypothetical protein
MVVVVQDGNKVRFFLVKRAFTMNSVEACVMVVLVVVQDGSK